MNIIEDIKDKVSHYITISPKLSITITSIILLLFLSTIVLGIAQCTQSASHVKRVSIPRDDSFELVDDLFKPEDKPLAEDYYFSREPKDKWTESEFDQWFTIPDEQTLGDLKRANDSLIDKITGAAP